MKILVKHSEGFQSRCEGQKVSARLADQVTAMTALCTALNRRSIKSRDFEIANQRLAKYIHHPHTVRSVLESFLFVVRTSETLDLVAWGGVVEYDNDMLCKLLRDREHVLLLDCEDVSDE